MTTILPEPIAPRYPGSAPFDEAWFLELQLTRELGLWIRYTLTDGLDPHRAVWAMFFGPDGVIYRRERLPLTHPEDDPAAAFSCSQNRLDARRAHGRAGDIRWSLRLASSRPATELIPDRLQRSGLQRRIYRPVYQDLRVEGIVHVGKLHLNVSDGHGSLGHVYGHANPLQRWTWAHANTFSDREAVFEGLGAVQRVGMLRTPRLTSLALRLDGHVYAFNRVRDLVRTHSRWDATRWHFEARRGSTRLEGEATLPDDHLVAMVPYVDADGTTHTCRNSRLSTLTLRLVDPSRGIHRLLETDHAAFEIGQRDHRGPTSSPFEGS